jgi:regulator of Ty1 transposition protein 109
LSFSYCTSCLDEDAENCLIMGARELAALVHSQVGLARLVSAWNVLPVDFEAIDDCPFQNLSQEASRRSVDVLDKVNYATLDSFRRAHQGASAFASTTTPISISHLAEHALNILVCYLIMAAHEKSNTKTLIASPTFLQQLATVLPKSVSFKIYHLSTPPTKTSALYFPPPGTRPDRTYCESHFLAASIRTPSKGNASETVEVLVYAVEILIYSTAYDTTFFVSKADSTGYLHLLSLVKGTPSPIRDITATFLRHLVEQHQRQNIRSVISLFARAQDQYLFPGSVEYSGKHVLDDRGLVRWWCRVLDPLIEQSTIAAPSEPSQWESVKGYLTVPGLDSHETLSYIPRMVGSNQSWRIGHPLKEISRHSDDAPPRCLIPHYPDDPKARFLDELDDEITKSRNTNGQWKSVRSIDQFWDMMAFRQECSAGRLVGFIWIVFTPKTQLQPTESVIGYSQSTLFSGDSQTWDTGSSQPTIPENSSLPVTPATSFNASSQIQPTSSPFKQDIEDVHSALPHSSKPQTPVRKKKKLTGPIIPRQPRIKTENKNYLLERPETSPYYIWHPEGRGQIIIDESAYKRVTELLLRLDFANLELATSSSNRWINEVRSGAWGSMSEAWGQVVTGTKVVEVRSMASAAGVNTLTMGLVRKKRKDPPEETKEPDTSTSLDTTPKVNVLSAGMIRKKAKS